MLIMIDTYKVVRYLDLEWLTKEKKELKIYFANYGFARGQLSSLNYCFSFGLIHPRLIAKLMHEFNNCSLNMI